MFRPLEVYWTQFKVLITPSPPLTEALIKPLSQLLSVSSGVSHGHHRLLLLVHIWSGWNGWHPVTPLSMRPASPSLELRGFLAQHASSHTITTLTMKWKEDLKFAWLLTGPVRRMWLEPELWTARDPWADPAQWKSECTPVWSERRQPASSVQHKVTLRPLVGCWRLSKRLRF